MGSTIQYVRKIFVKTNISDTHKYQIIKFFFL